VFDDDAHVLRARGVVRIVEHVLGAASNDGERASDLVRDALAIAVIGGLILWFGWYGFNPCSTLSIMDAAGVGRVAMNTTLAACTGGIAAVFVGYFMLKKWDTSAIINGFLAGLVAITCPATGSATSALASWARWPVCW
jgi:ammonia channel protein AmtB